jgi:hypothetical protein
MKFILTLIGSALCAVASSAFADAQCRAASPAHRVALVELYTSEGCNSCPPADRWLRERGGEARVDRWIPLALHVDYWNSLGWTDRFSRATFTARQQQLAARAGDHAIYTPEVFVAGHELRRWHSDAAFGDAIARINALPAPADIALTVSPVRAAPDAADSLDDFGQFAWRPGASVPPPGAHAYLAVYENRLVSHVDAGENAGTTLEHDYVVRRWIGPLNLGPRGLDVHETIRVAALAADARAEQLGVVAFVQDGRSGEVLQAVALPACW